MQIPPPQLQEPRVPTGRANICSCRDLRSFLRSGSRTSHWLAGLLEGEGNFRSQGRRALQRSPAAAVRLDGGLRDIVDALPQRCSSALSHRSCRLGGKAGATAYAAESRGARCSPAGCSALRPLLGTWRQAQIDRAIASYGPDPRRRLDDERATDGARAAGQRASPCAPGGRALRDEHLVHLRPAPDAGTHDTHHPSARPPSGPCVGSARGLLRCPFPGRGRRGDYAEHSHRLQAE